jgi:hypothetical protein
MGQNGAARIFRRMARGEEEIGASPAKFWRGGGVRSG